MRCAILKKPGEVQIQDQPQPEPTAEEVLIEVEMAALCGSDNSLYHGKMEVDLPVILGHEAVGRLARLGDNVTDLTIGQRVVIQPNFSCNTCAICQSGLANICPEKIRLGIDVNGVFAQYTVAPARYVWPIPDSLVNETAIFVEPMAVAYHAMSKCPPRKGQRVLIFGAGVLGLILTQLVTLKGSTVFGFDLVQQRLDLAERLGAKSGFQEADLLAEQGPFDVIFETSGAPGALSQAIDLAAPGASIVVAGLPAVPHPVLTTPIVRKELRIFGSIIYTDEFPEVIKLLESGQFKTQPLISGIYDLAELPAALDSFCEPHRVKSLIRVKEE